MKIEAYEYSDVPGIKHLFFYFEEDSKKAIPYFILDKKVWEKLQSYRTEIHTTKGLSHDMDQRKEYVSFRFFQP